MAKKNRHAAEVAALTESKFAPQVQALMMLLQQARGDRQQGIDVARSTGRVGVQLARQAQPLAAASLAESLGRIGQVQSEAVPQLGAPGQAGVVAQGTNRDLALARARASVEGQQFRDSLVQRAQDAQAGAAAGVLQAQRGYEKTRGDLAQQLQNLSGQQGAFAAGELSKLLAADTRRGQQVADREDSQSFQRSQQQRGFDHTDANRKPPVSKLGKAERKAQQSFVKAHALFSQSTYQVPDSADPSKKVDVPITKDYVRKHRGEMEGSLVGSGLSREMARRVVSAYLTVGSGDPGSFKKYRAGKVGSAVGGVKVPANPFA